MANLYLKGIPMSARYRVDWPAHKLQEMFRKTRAEYEGSTDFDNYKRSGQNSELYYPDFNHANNPMMHYLIKHVPTGVIMGDLPPGATLDTTGSPDDQNDDSDSESGPPDEQERDDEQVEESDRRSPARFRRPRSQRVTDSPASSIASSASAGRGRSRSTSRGRGRGRGLTSMGSAHKTLQRACDQILRSFDTMQEQYRQKEREERRPSSNDVISRSKRALNIIRTKRQVLAEIKLVQDSDSDHEDELQLLQTTLRSVTDEIQKYTVV